MRKKGNQASGRGALEDSVVAGNFDFGAPFIRDQIVGSHMAYKLCECSMIFVPGIIRYRWVCYGWDLKANKIYVFDPICHEGNMQELVQEHSHVIQLIKNATEISFTQLCSGWVHEWGAASVDIICYPVEITNCINSSGYAVLQFCFHFDGLVSSLQHIKAPSTGCFKSLLMDVVKLNDNHGIIPEGLW